MSESKSPTAAQLKAAAQEKPAPTPEPVPQPAPAATPKSSKTLVELSAIRDKVDELIREFAHGAKSDTDKAPAKLAAIAAMVKACMDTPA